QLDAMRAARLRKLRAEGRSDVRGLLDALFMPIVDLTDETGRHVYAHFLLRQDWRSIGDVWTREKGLVPTAREFQNELRTLLAPLPAKAFRERLSLVTILFFHAVTRSDEVVASGGSAAWRKKYLIQALDMCVAGLTVGTD